MDSAYLEKLLSWRRQKEDDLLRRDSWLALAGLHWLAEGRQVVGSAPAADVHLPPGSPDVLGEIELRTNQIIFHPAPGLLIEGVPADGESVSPDTADNPTYLRLGDLTLLVIERGRRFGLRIWDNAGHARTTFGGRFWYPPDPAYVIRAAFEPGAPEATIPVLDVTGGGSDERLMGTAHFHFSDRPASLWAIPTDGGQLWFLFADPTNGVTTYPSGRFLVAEPAQDGVANLDFNRAYSPPCAFTAFATCPIPPPGNKLSFPIEAGERYEDEF
jgi:hypothetical protein